VRAAISAGYAKGFHTIVDANVVTAITALVLFGVATSEVQGFALMLLIGTAISLVTAVAATRAMLGMLAGFRWFADPRFMGRAPARFRAGSGSTSSAAAAVVCDLGRRDRAERRRARLQGLNLGIDFTGGAQITFSTPKPVAQSTVSRIAASVAPDAVVQGRGSSSGDDYRSFQIRTKPLKSADQSELTATSPPTCTPRSSASTTSRRASRVRYSTARSRGDRLVPADRAVCHFRYRWRFAVPILRTLISDIPIMLGVYAISGREVTTDTVAAILTILGYSIYDTIIVFDRIRENMRLMPRASIATIANTSVSEVLKRSIVTLSITLLPIVALFVFGGSTLRDFAFAIMSASPSAASPRSSSRPRCWSADGARPEYAGDAVRPGTPAKARARCARPSAPRVTSRHR